MGDTSRRDWLRAILPTPEPAPPPPPRRRPPGALPERDFLSACTGCLECVTACPMSAIFSLAPHVHPGAGTPVLLPDERACAMCAGFPCAAACPEPALTVPEATVWRLGLVQVDRHTCLPHQGPECGACVGHCPPGAYEALRLVYGKPRVDPEICVGCGLCIRACVTEPRSLYLAPLEPAC